jgi:lysophospholipase L1-like esterase
MTLRSVLTAQGYIVDPYLGPEVSPIDFELQRSRTIRVQSWARGPMVVSPDRANTTAYTAGKSTALKRANGDHTIVTGSGTTAGAEPTGLLDGRPLTDGTVTVYSLGVRKAASDADAPTISQVAAASLAGAGLSEVRFATGGLTLQHLSSADGMVYSRSGSYVASVNSAIGNASASGNSTGDVPSAVLPPVTLPANEAYSTVQIDSEFMVNDRMFGITCHNFGASFYLLVDGQPVQLGETTIDAGGGNAVVLDFGGVAKPRRVAICTVGAAHASIRGCAITAQGSVYAVPRIGDVMLCLGDSFNNTVAPNVVPHLDFFLKRYLGVDGLVNAAVGGSGYIAASVANTYNILAVLNSPSNLLLWPYYSPRHVLIQAGGNDKSLVQADIRAAAIATWQRVRALFPTAKITITDGHSGAAGPDSQSLTTATTLAEAFVYWADPNSRFIPVVTTLAATAWISGTTNAGEALSAGNSSLWTSTDDTHPSPGGARYLARRLAEAIDAAWDSKY